jgi:hypothetical protein
MRGVILFLAAAISLSPLKVFADPAPAAVPNVVLPDGVPALPEPTDDAAPLKIINSSNISSYKAVVPAELQWLFHEGQLEIEAAARLKNPVSYGQAWDKATAEAKDSALAGATLRQGTKLGEGFIFGDSRAIVAEGDSKNLARKILWNIYSVWAAEKVFGAQFDFHWIKESKPYRTLRGEFSRIYPALLGDPKQSAQLFRELIRLSAPVVLTDLSWLTFRFLGADEDVLWVFSPAVKKLRQVTSTNRSDSILRSAVSPEDFLVWSGKPEIADALVEKSLVGLAFFPRTDLPAAEAGKCVVIDRAAAVANRMPVRWNFDSNRYSHGGGWIPSTSMLVPRKLWQIELNSQDPFSLYGHQVLYVDQETMLPMYKFVYNRSGQLWKTVIGAFGFAAKKGSEDRRPYPAYTIIIDHVKAEAYLLDFSKISICSEPVPSLSMSDFDPKRFADMSKASAPTQLPAATPQGEVEEPDEL